MYETPSHGYPSSTHPQLSNDPGVEGILGKDDATVMYMPDLWRRKRFSLDLGN